MGIERSIGQLKNFGRATLNKMAYTPDKCSNQILTVVCLFNIKKLCQLTDNPNRDNIPPSRLPNLNNQTPAQYRDEIANTFFA